MAKNAFGKTRSKDDPYAIYKGYGPMGDTEVRVLKTYQHVDNERKNPYARWFVAIKTDMTWGDFELGDSYINGLLRGLKLTTCTEEWRNTYV